jgi:hypothetical protein
MTSKTLSQGLTWHCDGRRLLSYSRGTRSPAHINPRIVLRFTSARPP